MDSNEFVERRKAAYTKLDEVIAELHAICTAEAIDEHGADVVDEDVPTDAVLLIGSQNYYDDGDRVGCVTLCPRSGSQPAYITAGLLQMALARVTA